jgi:hypothetical protein
VLIAVSSKYSDRRGGGSEVKFNCLLKFFFSKRTMKMHVQNQSKTNCVAQQTTTSNNEIYHTKHGDEGERHGMANFLYSPFKSQSR